MQVIEIDSSSHRKNGTFEGGYPGESFKVSRLGSKKQIAAVAVRPALLARSEVRNAAFLPRKSNCPLQPLASRIGTLEVFSISGRQKQANEKSFLLGQSRQTVGWCAAFTSASRSV